MYIECNQCKSINDYENTDMYFDDKGYGYSTKLAKCKQCKGIIIVKHLEDSWLNVNEDERYYNYHKLRKE